MDPKDWQIRIEKKIDDLKEENSEQNVVLGRMEVLFEKNTEILEEHQRRSLASEKRLDIVEETVERTDKKIASHLAFLKGVVWVFGVGATLIGIATGLYRALN